jgi:hypothetical protein
MVCQTDFNIRAPRVLRAQRASFLQMPTDEPQYAGWFAVMCGENPSSLHL